MMRVNESRYEALCNTVPEGDGNTFVERRPMEKRPLCVRPPGIKGHRDRPGQQGHRYSDRKTRGGNTIMKVA